MGHHSTSDDSFAYRARKEVEDRKRLDNPIVRFRLFLEARGWWTAEEEGALAKRLKDAVVAAYHACTASHSHLSTRRSEDVNVFRT